MNIEEDSELMQIRSKTRELNIKIFKRITGKQVCQMCHNQSMIISEKNAPTGELTEVIINKHGMQYIWNGTNPMVWREKKKLQEQLDHTKYDEPNKCNLCQREDKVMYKDYSKNEYDKRGQIEYDMYVNKQVDDDNGIKNIRLLCEYCNWKKNEYLWKSVESIFIEFDLEFCNIIQEERGLEVEMPGYASEEKERIENLCEKFEVIISTIESDGRNVDELRRLYNFQKNFKRKF